MTESDEFTVETLQVLAHQADLYLTDEEVVELRKGVGRNRDFARSLRALVRPETEPSPIFHAPPKIS